MFLRGSTDHNNVRESLPLVPDYSEKNKTELWKSQLNSGESFHLESSGTLRNLCQSSEIIAPTDVGNLSKKLNGGLLRAGHYHVPASQAAEQALVE